MLQNSLKEKWRAGKPTFGVWCSIPSSYLAEICAHRGFDYVCIDLQHGMIDYSTATEMILAIHAGGSLPLVRVPSNDLGMINRMLDAGAMGIIIPLIESVSDVEAAVRACRYPPDGMRSFGPNRAALVGGADYFENANDNVLCIPMIETRPALEEVQGIASVPGVDALYVGPNDLSLSLGQAPGPDNPDPYQSAYRHIARICEDIGIVAGIQANASLATKHVETGYRMITICSDTGTLARGFTRDLKSVRGSQA